MYRFLMLVCLCFAALPAWAANAPAGPNADTTPLGSGTPPPQGQAANCPDRPPVAKGAPSNIVVELDPDTLWRPRGSEVRFTIRGPGAAVVVKQVRVCFGWSTPDGSIRQEQALIGSPQVRSVSNDTGATEYGAVVPRLRPVPWADWWFRRFYGAMPYVFTAIGTVPVADMVVEVTLADTTPVVVTAIQVGITSSAVAWIIVAIVALLMVMALHRVAAKLKPDACGSALWIISTPDGPASLSQLQIVLWTVVVGMSAIYVMTLSGNLISISSGTLTLLGIAGGTALVARIPGSAQPAGSPSPAPAAPAGATPTVPRWSDVIIADRRTNSIDVTRLQMLAFTLIAAGFVLIKVLVDYEIPTIPTNFLILMGISNGVYVAGRKLAG